MNLVIVESPTKAKTLGKYLGKEFEISASMGHIRDLPKSKMGVDVEHDFEPEYILAQDKGSVVKDLQAAAKKAKKVYLAMDPDREGEAIAWHVKFALSRTNGKFHRVAFHEITKEAILAAMDKPRRIDMNLVDAQQARRVVDRLVGYKLSPVLWKKVRRGLSAGRVQSAALRLIVEREEEIEKFKATKYFDIEVELAKLSGKESFVAQLIEIEGKKAPTDGFLITGKDQVDRVAGDLNKAKYQVVKVDKREQKKSPYPPFTTSTLQQAAANMFGWTAKQTMRVAQNLYEKGHITYHRTDSMSLSTQAVAAARKIIETEFGKKYLPEKPRVYKTKSKNAQEAHEAIRPTNLGTKELTVKGKMNAQHTRLYSLIWRRMVASQMVEAVYDSTTVTVGAKAGKEYTLRASGSVRKFDGWRKLFKRSKDDTVLPELTEQEKLKKIKVESEAKETQPPPRYNDASLVKALEERGIGRPSTYAPIISTILSRGYVERKEKRFFATIVGMVVTRFLLKNFSEVVDYDFTAEMEEDLDRIARGEKEWVPTVKTFWKPFVKKVEEVEEKAKRVEIPAEKTDRKCPECGAPVIIRTGRFGKFYSCSKFPECKFTESYVEKVEGMHCPTCKKGEVVVKKTRKGRMFYGCSNYPKCKWASWSKPEKKKKSN